LRGSVRIVPEEKYPFHITSVQPLEGKIKVQLDEVVLDGRKSYSLEVESLRNEAGSFFDTVRLKTDSPLQPEMDVRVYVYLRAQPAFEKKVN
jgi:hypothetical protein